MKTLFILCLLFLAISCEETRRSRFSECAKTETGCLEMSTLSVNEPRMKLIAHVTADIMVGKGQLVFLSHENDEDRDAETDYVCKLDVEAGAQFSYSIQNQKLILNNGRNTLTFLKKSGTGTDLTGSWVMVTNETKAQTILELNFLSSEEVQILKNCHLI